MRCSRLGAAALSALAVVAASCANDGDGGSNDGTIGVQAAFYPLVWMAEQVGGEHVTVESLTKAGAEPHDLELTPSDVAQLEDADLVVSLRGFQPAVDDALEQVDDDSVFDAAAAADLEQVGDAVDPHFWLDPTRLAAVAGAFAAKLAAVDPDHAAAYAENLAALTDRLNTLDAEFTAGLADCAVPTLVTSHDSFGYLARRYGLNQVGITGLTPEAEASPADLAEVTRLVEDAGVRTVYFEPLVSEDLARTVAEETGVATAVLDPLEGLDDSSQGDDYVEVMRSNLATLRAGQSCT